MSGACVTSRISSQPFNSPVLFGASSTTNSAQVPLGLMPLKTSSDVARDGVGAGGGNASFTPLFVG